MKINTTFVKFRKSSGSEVLITINDLLCSGFPIDTESGEELELVDDNVYRGDGSIVE
jgi:hypothetical protein